MKRRASGKRVGPDGAGDAAFSKLVAAFAADPRTAAIAREYAARRAAGGTRRFGSDGLQVDGKLFAMLVGGALVVKLPRARVDALIAERKG